MSVKSNTKGVTFSQKMTNSDWSLFLKKYHLGHVRFAEKILRDPDEARCVVYEAYGRILQKNYSLDKLDSICMTTVHRLSLNRLRGWNYHFSRIEDYTLILRNK